MFLRDVPSRPEPRRGLPGLLGLIALTIAASAIGFAIHLHGGEYTPLALLLITLALIATVATVIFSNRDIPVRNAFPPGSDAVDKLAKTFQGYGDPPRQALAFDGRERAARLIEYTLAGALLLQFIALFALWPVGVDQKRSYITPHNHRLYLYMIGIAFNLVVFGLMKSPTMRHWWFPFVLMTHSLLALWTIRTAPLPHIDVYWFQQLGPETLLQARNPYDGQAARFPDIYDSTLDGHQRVYGEGLVRGGHLAFGFPYPPLSLYLSTAGYVLRGDARFAQVVALTLAGLLIGYSRRGIIPKLAAVLFLFTPTEWFVLGRGWTEPLVVLFLAATVFCHCRNWRWMLPVAFGLLLASKQYLLLAVPLSFLLVPDFDWRSRSSWGSWIVLLLIAVATATTLTLPLALLDLRAFWFSTVTVQAIAPFRWDALSYLVWMGFHIHSVCTTWTWLAFAVVIPAIVLCLRRLRPGPAGFATAMALVYLVFIAFNKQAFCNYYFFVLGCLCCAIAASAPQDLPIGDTARK